MSDEIDLARAISRPQIDRQNEEGGIDLTARSVSMVLRDGGFVTRKSREHEGTDLISISFSVFESRTISRMHGGGVMGRLSCRLPCC